MNLDNVSAHEKPFRHWVVEDALPDVDALIEALKEEPFQRKECDLFQCFQGQDISLSKHPALQTLFHDLSSPATLEKIKKITGVKVTHIDMSPFIYGDTDYLLPHDDQLEGRKIAYVIYLNDVPDSGSLDLFNGKHIEKRIFPKKGQVVLFEVSAQSLHQVREVVDNERITFAGWFYG